GNAFIPQSTSSPAESALLSAGRGSAHLGFPLGNWTGNGRARFPVERIMNRCILFRGPWRGACFARRASVWVGLGVAWTLSAAPANSPKKANSEAKDSGPVLMSRTGGGGWPNVKELEAAASKGNPKAQAQLGEMLLRGDGIAKNE